MYLMLVVIAHAASNSVPPLAIDILGALVFVTTVVSGLDYVITYTQKAVAASRQRRGLTS